MEGSSSSWQSALEIVTGDDPLGPYLCHIQAENLAYTLIRSIIFVKPDQINEVFNFIHSLEHLESKQKSRLKKQDHPILSYWQEKAAICGGCTSFLCELIASSWRYHGPSISDSHSCDRLLRPGLKPDAIAIMANLFKYMNAAYERLERETKDALQTESHSSAFADACIEYFGQNFETTQEPERLKKLLFSLQETNVHILILRLISRHHIEDCVETDKKELSELKKAREEVKEVTIALFEGTGSQTKQQPAPTPTKGKNYSQNKKRAERKKRQRANITGNSQVEVEKYTTESLKETVDKSAASAERHDGSILEDENAAHIPHTWTVIEDIDIADGATSTERVEWPNVEDDVAVSPTIFEQSIKMDIIVSADLHKATGTESSSSIVLDSVGKQIATVALEDIKDQSSPYEHERHLEDTFENEDDHNWTQVVGTRKKSKKSNRTGVYLDATNASPISGSPRFARRVNNQRGGENSVAALEIAPSPSRCAQTFVPLQKLQTSSKPPPGSVNSKPSGSANSASALTVPKPSTPEKKALTSAAPTPVSIQETASGSIAPEITSVEKAVSTAAIAEPAPLQKLAQVSVAIEEVSVHPKSGPDSTASTIEDHPLPTASSSTSKNRSAGSVPKSAKSRVDILPSAPEKATASTTPVVLDNRCNLASATSTDLKVAAPATTAASIVDSQCDTKKLALSPPSELIDPGPVPHYRHLKPFKKVKMSDTSETTLATTITPLTDTFSLVESLRDAGVDDDALSSLVPRASAMTMSSTHLRLPNASSSHRAFAGKNLNVRRANNLPTSAGNSPVPPQPEREPVYHYPPPDVLTPENQEILDLIIKGPPYKKYPRVPKAAGQEETQNIITAFVTKKPAITTYDGNDAYEVLGERCPAPLTLKDHPNVNKCIHLGEIFHCVYCRVEISGNAEAEKGIICPGCGPCSETRYCQRSHLLADSINHFEVCGQKPGTYPMMWSELPLHYQSLYPYIKPLTGTMTAQCFRQMAHCLVINSDGIIQHPFKAYFETQMPMEDKVKTHNYIKQMYQFQDKGFYYLFHPSPVAGGVDIEVTINMHNGTGGYFREDQRFARVRNAAFLTQHPTLLCVLYRRIKDVLVNFPGKGGRTAKLIQFLNIQFREEFPAFNMALVARLDKSYTFQDDWGHVRHLVHDLELGNPILRAWITEDAEDNGVPADPTVRHQGKHWNLVIGGPTFRAGSADRKDWGAGWFGGDEEKWQKQLDRKYRKMVTDELAKIETELEGEII